MRKRIHFLIVIWMASCLVGCGSNRNIDNVNRNVGVSKQYTEDEINDAMDIVISYFEKNFKGCTLTDIWYDENKISSAELKWAETYNAEQAIILLSNFNTDKNCDASLNPNDIYIDWNWILVRDNNGKWILKAWGGA